jgi:hypothetical protein
MWPRLALVLLLAGLGGCAKPPPLPEIAVRAGSADELAGFRAELGSRFAAEQLQPIDTALQELKLDAMNRGVATADAREQAMLAVVNGKTVRETLVLGWQARRARLLRERAQLAGMLEPDLRLRQQTAANGTPESVSTRIQNEQDILARLQRDLTDAEGRLTAWGAPPDPAVIPPTPAR